MPMNPAIKTLRKLLKQVELKPIGGIRTERFRLRDTVTKRYYTEYGRVGTLVRTPEQISVSIFGWATKLQQAGCRVSLIRGSNNLYMVEY